MVKDRHTASILKQPARCLVHCGCSNVDHFLPFIFFLNLCERQYTQGTPELGPKGWQLPAALLLGPEHPPWLCSASHSQLPDLDGPYHTQGYITWGHLFPDNQADVGKQCLPSGCRVFSMSHLTALTTNAEGTLSGSVEYGIIPVSSQLSGRSLPAQQGPRSPNHSLQKEKTISSPFSSRQMTLHNFSDSFLLAGRAGSVFF